MPLSEKQGANKPKVSKKLSKIAKKTEN